jgi:ABC-type uncharacterized transport system permease subunit
MGDGEWQIALFLGLSGLIMPLCFLPENVKPAE